ncbi:kinesin-domain-containing protein [Punctularia strigosozonata HHB-11173 SS5]|uniref:kinesin-domain-containing protein n=1 Tax=Punctularia strigosozonata (strain HHB-11173) TaxID=741275 RepID=UPI00044174C5|nr:kinesin-domain-containing protein [Punctularia strigosozonata HHB-11173 SS5]EIN07350.1 kinesin-domain-containing protein [Punctularia strigosozonata HHB-11173 SS5]
MSKPGPSQRSVPTPVEDTFQPQDSLAPSTIPTSPKRRGTNLKADEHGETNIKVVIRCRRRSDREVQENSPIIVSSQGARSQELSIETAAPVSSLGLVTLPPTRTYPFDLVYGPEADQAMVYQDVVAPMLEEVLQGYNCTLFAYGQTGTGKTYTMQGDLSPTPLGNPSPQAGMIPRVLFRLFHQLEATVVDYSVKVSLIELYNEELRDLLAPELSAPAGSTQPMGRGTSSKDLQDGGLKIFEDASKKGVFIQGLQEVNVKDAKDAMAVLTKGSQRRQIAATKFNDHSSRSHSVFSITVHTKETSSLGDDLLRVGKMNLVDLAGSENIGRSGAENKRAREAGMINQSLLTLGRVINALVDRASYVPYRESKLTRLLQDSLGGRTKTCIVATVSPARSNMEETLSTLDYAMRAKSIRNKPEVNQRMTRNALLKEYVAEIERLKADVLAAREKNGIFFSEETWTQMSAEQELAKTEMEEARRQVEMVESQLRSVREEFEQSMSLLMKREGELKKTQETLEGREKELEVRGRELRKVKGALEEEVVVRKAYQTSETSLDGVATGLRDVAHESLRDLAALFDKLDRKSGVLGANAKVVLSHGRILAGDLSGLSSKLEEFFKTSTHHALQLRTEAEQYQHKEQQVLNQHCDKINEQLRKVQELLGVVQAKDQVVGEAVRTIQTTVDDTVEGLKTGFGSWADGLRKKCEAMCSDVEIADSAAHVAAERALKSTASLIDTIIREAQQFIEDERKSALAAKNMTDTVVNAEVLRLREQNALLVQLLDTQKVDAERARDDLLQRVSGLLGEFTAERDRSLRETFKVIHDSNDVAEQNMSEFTQAHSKGIAQMTERGKTWSESLEKRSGEGKRTRDGVLKSLVASHSAVKDGAAAIRDQVSASVASYSTDIQRSTQALNTACAGAHDRFNRAKRARLDATNQIAADAQSGYRTLQQGMTSTSKNIGAAMGKVISEGNTLYNMTESFHSSATSYVSSARQATQAIVEQGTREDRPTGATPSKRSWKYVDRWELAKPRDALLRDWRQNGSSSVGDETFTAEHLPLPDDEEDVDVADEAPFSLLDEDTPIAVRVETTPISPPLEEMPSSPPRQEVLAEEAPSSLLNEDMSPALASSVSSVSSASTIAPPVVPLKKIVGKLSKSGLPKMGTLRERSSNVPARSRRVR